MDAYFRSIINDVTTKFGRYEIRNKIHNDFIVKFTLIDNNHNICILFSIDKRHANVYKILDYVEKCLRYRQETYNYVMQNLVLFERTTANKYKHGIYRLHINDNHIFIKKDNNKMELQSEEIINHYPEIVVKRFNTTKSAKF